MLISEAEGRLRARLPSLDSTSPSEGIAVMLSLYADVRVPEVDLEADGDMLLFQWGTYDWGDGATFTINVTRQFIELDPDADAAMSQLQLTFHFEPSAALQALKSGDFWCHRPVDVADFRRRIAESPVVRAIEGVDCIRAELLHELV